MGCNRLTSNSLPVVEIEEISKHISDFSSEIGSCFDNSDWDRLVAVLIARQTYFEQILVPPVGDDYRETLIKLVEDVLVQDADSLTKIQEHKKQILALHLLLENGQRAIKAYKGR